MVNALLFVVSVTAFIDNATFVETSRGVAPSNGMTCGRGKLFEVVGVAFLTEF